MAQMLNEPGRPTTTELPATQCAVAWTSFTLSVVSMVLAFCAAFMTQQWIKASINATGSTSVAWLLIVLLYGLPIVLGVTSIILANYSFSRVEASEGRLIGNGPSVFGVFFSGLTLVTAATMIVADFLWDNRIPEFISTLSKQG
jgi:uncharacterized membrane protein (DUF485 family)